MLTNTRRLAGAFWLALRLGWGSDRGLARHLAYLGEAAVLHRWLAASGVTHVHAHFATNSAAVARLCHALGGPPYSFTAHGPDDFDRAPGLALGEKVAQARFVVTVSEYGRKLLLPWCATSDWQKVHVVRCGVDQLFLNAPRTPMPAAPRLVCVARLAPEKGQAFLLDAIARLRAEGLECELALLGDGPTRPALEARIQQLGLAEVVQVCGWASSVHVRDAILAARALVLPSLAENLPVVLMEALALGRPVVATNIAACAELVEPGVNGWLVRPGSVEALADAVREVLQTPIARLEWMGQAGAARVAAKYDALASARTLATLFRGNPGPHGHPPGVSLP